MLQAHHERCERLVTLHEDADGSRREEINSMTGALLLVCGSAEPHMDKPLLVCLPTRVAESLDSCPIPCSQLGSLRSWGANFCGRR
eukprot:6211529-Pleurochrysis_carterae.AAC.2